MIITNMQATRWRPACKNNFGRPSGYRNESQIIIGKKNIHRNQKAQACASETGHRSASKTAGVKVNRITSPLHKPRATQSGASLSLFHLSFEDVVNDCGIALPARMLKRCNLMVISSKKLTSPSTSCNYKWDRRDKRWDKPNEIRYIFDLHAGLHSDRSK